MNHLISAVDVLRLEREKQRRTSKVVSGEAICQAAWLVFWGIVGTALLMAAYVTGGW